MMFKLYVERALDDIIHIYIYIYIYIYIPNWRKFHPFFGHRSCNASVLSSLNRFENIVKNKLEPGPW